MSGSFEDTWETYAAAWKAETAAEKQALFERCLDPSCVYTDPLQQTRGWAALIDYMLDFHQQIPGGHFVTRYFLAHHDVSIARWEMRGGDGSPLGDGISYGVYNPQGLLVGMTGFFEPTPS